jgi:urease subunit gamma
VPTKPPKPAINIIFIISISFSQIYIDLFFKFSATPCFCYITPELPFLHRGTFFARHQPNLNLFIMHLTPREIDKLTLLTLGLIAERRLKKGLKLNHPEAVAYITSAALEGAREGKTVEEVMTQAASVLRRSDVMDGVADMITLLQVEAVFTDGSRLISIHHPIK